MATDTTITGTFALANGSPLNLGYIELQLSHDGQNATTPNQIVSGLKRRITFNSSGVISPAVAIYSNTNLVPAGSFYLARVYEADGTEAIPLSKITIPSGAGPTSISTLTWTELEGAA